MTAFRLFAAGFAALLTLTACGPRTPDGPAPVSADVFEGAWHGTLSIAGQSLRLELELATGEDGVEGALISLDQSAARMPLTALTIEGDQIAFAADPPGLSYDGVLEDGRITGQFRQSVLSVELVFEPGRFDRDEADAGGDTARERAPGETRLTLDAGGVMLGGTLRLPEGDATGPGVVILSGSGSQDRDGTFGEVAVYAALADALAQAGVASLRLDDRGVGESSGPAPQAPADLAADAAAALAALRDQPRVQCAGFAGHSEGGLIALLAAPQADPAFIVSLAGMHMPMAQTLYDQSEALIRAGGGGDAQVAANRRLQEAMFAVYDAVEPGADITQALAAALTGAGAPEALAAQQAAIWGQPYAAASFAVDPVAAAAAYDGPLLGVFGEFDLQVLAQAQSQALTAARPDAPTQIVILEGVNHLFQQTETGLPSEYGSADHPLSAQALSTIAQRTAALAAQACRD